MSTLVPAMCGNVNFLTNIPADFCQLISPANTMIGLKLKYSVFMI